MWYAGLPFPPDVKQKFSVNRDSVENLCLTWQRQKSDLYYLINISSGMEYNETSTELCLEVVNKTSLQVSVVAVNCAGRSEPAIANISMHMSMTYLVTHHITSFSLSWLWSSQSTSEWQCW